MEMPNLALDIKSTGIYLGMLTDDPETGAKATVIILNRGGKVPPDSYLSIETHLPLTPAIQYTYDMQNSPIRVVFTIALQYFVNDSMEINPDYYTEVVSDGSVRREYRIPIDISFEGQTLSTLIMFEVRYARPKPVEPFAVMVIWIVAIIVIVILVILATQLLFPPVPIP